MRIETQPQGHPTATTGETARLLVSFELSQSKWVLIVRAPASAKLSRFTVPSRDTEKVSSLLTAQRQQAERRTARPVQIVSIYEAGLDGFWLHRWLETQEVEEPCGRCRHRSSARSADATPKPTGLTGRSCCAACGCLAGRRSGRVLDGGTPPSVAQEDLRRLSRERGRELVDERTRLSNRVGGLLANQGIAGFKPLKR